MTLIIAKKIAGSIFIIADTSSFEIGFHRPDPSEFTPKIIPYKTCAIAFAGIIEPAHDGLSFRDLEHPSSMDVIKRCQELSLHYKGQLDFIHIDYRTLTITKIADGICEIGENHVWLGSQQGFNKFQEVRLNGLSDAELGISNAAVWIVKQPENTSEPFLKEYNASLTAFNEILRHSNLGIGGFAVPFIVNHDEVYFGFYTDIDSGFDRPKTLFDQWQTVELNFNEPEVGSFARSFTGSSSGFRVTIPQILKEFEWHSPFLEQITPPVSQFIDQKSSVLPKTPICIG